MILIYALIVSVGFGALYYQSAHAQTHNADTALLVGALAFGAFAISFLAPPRFFRYTHAQLAPEVMAQLMQRAVVAAGIVLALNIAVWLWLGRAASLGEELYMYALVALFLFHGFGGVVANHVMYLQATKQYNSNQLAAILLLVTFILLILVLFFVALDWGAPHDAYIHARDLTLITLVLVGYGRAVYLMAHH
ncbi:MAG: hypothetical protein HY257_10195 [Chloroflexi bacterium]|nr:hypothetical protein [Chloroflexota bacterium]